MLRARKRFTAILSTLAFLSLAGIAKAETTTPNSGDWRFEFTPYAWFTGIDGTIGVKGEKTNIDVTYSDLEQYISIANMGIFEASKDRWIFAVEGLFVKLNNEETKTRDPLGTQKITVNAEFKQELYQGSVGYRVVDSRTKVDVFGAARYTYLYSETKVKDVSSGPILPGGKVKIDGSQSWTDPVIGVRVLHPINEHWTLMGLVDVGGFGANGDIDRTYQGIAGVNWQFSKHFAAKAGYRYLYQNYQDDGFVWDVVMQAPYIALGIQF